MNGTEAYTPNTSGRPAAPPPPSAYARKANPIADLQREYVSGRPNPRIERYVEALPQHIDDLSRDISPDIYERMLQDAQVYSCVEILKLSVMSEGYEVTPSIQDKKDPDYQTSLYYRDFCERLILNLDKPFEQFLYEMLDGLSFGNKIAEKIGVVLESGEDSGRLVLSKLKVKPRQSYTYVVDAFFNIVGIIAVIPGRSYILYQGSSLYAPDELPNLLPRQKFCVFTYNPKDSDPRGRSVQRPAYDPWWCKLQVKGEYLKYLAQFGSPSIWGTTPEGATSQAPADELGNPTGVALVTPEEQMASTLAALRAGSAAAFPYGSNVQMLTVSAEANFSAAFDFYDKQIAKAILGQTLATEEGEHQARAAAETHKDILDMPMSNVRRTVEAMVKKDIFHEFMRYNFGDEIADRYCPRFVLGSAEKEDWGTNVSAVSSLCSAQYLAPSQMGAMDEKLNLPPRTDKSGYEKQLEQSPASSRPAENSETVAMSSVREAVRDTLVSVRNAVSDVSSSDPVLQRAPRRGPEAAGVDGMRGRSRLLWTRERSKSCVRIGGRVE